MSASGNGYIWGVNRGDVIYKTNARSHVMVHGNVLVDASSKLTVVMLMFMELTVAVKCIQYLSMELEVISHPGIRMKHNMSASGKDDVFAISTTNELN